MTEFRPRPVIAGLAAAALLLAAGAAHAQGVPSTRSGFQPPVKQKALPGDVPQQPPPALPGATATYQPAERTATDLSPTDALFDAINRGDIASARDAINRGADLYGHNILGMTPVELSVDLSRNDITFLLLSLRGGGGGNGGPLQATPVSAQTNAPAEKLLVGKPARPAAKPKPVVAAARPAPAPVPVQQQFAGTSDPGTPNPQAGFLGFNGTAR